MSEGARCLLSQSHLTAPPTWPLFSCPDLLPLFLSFPPVRSLATPFSLLALGSKFQFNSTVNAMRLSLVSEAGIGGRSIHVNRRVLGVMVALLQLDQFDLVQSHPI